MSLFSVKLKAFYRFTDTTEALAAASSLIESKLSSDLRRFLKKNIVGKGLTDELGVSDAKLGGLIKDKLGISVSHSFLFFRFLDSIGYLGEFLIPLLLSFAVCC